MDAATTTRSKRSSRPLPAPCAQPAARTSAWRRCCPRPRGYCRFPHICQLRQIWATKADEGSLYMITLIDYKAGNLTSVRKAFTHLGQETVITEDPAQVREAEALVLPGVGHFVTTKRLADSGVRDAVLEAI